MESKPHRLTAEEASAALLDAEATRATLADHIATPSWFFVSIGVAIAAQIATVAVGLGDKHALDGGAVGAPWLVAAAGCTATAATRRPMRAASRSRGSPS